MSAINFKDFLYYDESSPTRLRWLVDIWVGKNFNRKAISKGDPAGCLNKVNGYYQVRLKRRTFRIHRLILVLFNQPISNGKVVDHIDGNKLNNSISNLRIVSLEENAKNRITIESNTGIPYLHKTRTRYQVALVLNNQRYTKTFNFLSLGGEETARYKAIDYLLSMKESMLKSGYTERQINNITKGLNDSNS